MGKAKVDEGADFIGLSRQVADGEVELTGERTGILLEGKRILLNEVNAAKARLDAAPGDKKALQELESAQQQLDDYVQNVQAGKGRWSDVGRALQAGTQLDTGDYASVLEAARRTGKSSAKLEKELESMAAEVAKRDAEIARLKANPREFDAKQAVSQARARRYDKTALKSNIEANRKKLSELRGTVGVGASKKRGAASVITADDLKVAKDQALIVRDIALDYARLGMANLEDVVIAVQKALRADGIEIDRQAVVDAITTTAEGRPKSVEAQRVYDLKNQAKAETSEALAQPGLRRQKRKSAIEAAIEEDKGQVRTGFKVARAKKVRTVDDEIADLEAQRRIWDSRVRNKLKDAQTGWGRRQLRGASDLVRGTQLGSDLGVAFRQGLFFNPLTRPRSWGRAAVKAVRNAFSEQNLAKWANDNDNFRYSDGKLASRVEREAGLSTTDALNSREEMVFTRLVQKIPGIGKAIGGSLERAQTTFINEARREMFRSLYERGASMDDLKVRARFVNNATGRGNWKNVPEDLGLVLTSPRYEASRWGTIAEIVRNPVEMFKNKGARENMADLATAAGTVYGVFKIAEAAGYKTSYDPDSPDFLKLRLGEEVWDVTAGLAPRIRDVFRAIKAFGNPEWGSTYADIAGRSVVRTVSPAVRTPIEEGSYAYQRAHPEYKKDGTVKEPKSPFSGMGDEGDIHGWEAFAPLIWQSFHQSLNRGEPLPKALGTAAKEAVGTGVNYFPSKEQKEAEKAESKPTKPTSRRAKRRYKTLD